MLAHLYSLVHSRSLLAYTGNRWVIMNRINIGHRVQASPWIEETSYCKCECWWEHENNQISSLQMFFHHCFSPNYNISGVCCCRCLTGGCITKHTNTARTKTLNTTKVVLNTSFPVKYFENDWWSEIWWNSSKQHQITCLYLPLEHIIECSVLFVSPHLTCKTEVVIFVVPSGCLILSTLKCVLICLQRVFSKWLRVSDCFNLLVNCQNVSV